MSFLRNVASDLVEKKLWPIAVALLVALVAVPVVLGRSGATDPSTDADTTVAHAARTTDPAAGGQVTLDTSTLSRRDRAGKVRDPFIQQHKPADTVATATAPTTTTATGTGAGGGTAVGAGAGTGATKTTPSPATVTPPAGSRSGGSKADPLDTYRVTLRFGKSGSLKTIKDLPRMTPLPSADAPFFVFLGVMSNGKTATFLISSDVTATGDGVCKPSKTDCQTIEMRAGDTEFFDFGTGDNVRQYQMDLRKVAKHQASSTAVAARAHKRQSTAGRKTLQLAKAAGVAPGAYRYRYDYTRGVLRRVPHKTAAKAAKKHTRGRASSILDPLYELRAVLGATAVKLAAKKLHH